MRASEALRKIWRTFSARVLMSGTLKPFKAFAEISGISRFRSVSGRFPVPKENVLPIVLSGLTTKGEELPKEMAEKYVSSIASILSKVEKNTAVFFASYRIMGEILDELLQRIDGIEKQVFVEKEGMRGDEAKKVLQAIKSGSNIVLLANPGLTPAEVDTIKVTVKGLSLIHI